MNLYKVLAIFSLSMLVLGGLYLAYIQFTQKNGPGGYAGPVEKINLEISSGAPELSSLIYIAEKKGYFTQQGLQINSTLQASGITIQRDIATGSADLGTTSDFGFVSDSFTIPNLRILAIINKALLIDIIARKDKGIIVPKDLKGKKIGIVPKTAPQFYLGRFLTFNNLNLSDVTVVPTTFAKMQSDITQGVVDAVVINDPFAYQIKQVLGDNKVVWNAQQETANNWLLISSKETIQSNSKPIGRFIQALLQAEDFVNTNPSESQQIVKAYLKSDPTYFAQNWSKNTFLVSLDQALILSMEDEARWRIENKLTNKTQIPNYLDFIDLDTLGKAKPDAVTIIH